MVSVDAAMASVLSELKNIFSSKEEQERHGRLLDGNNVFTFLPSPSGYAGNRVC